MSSIVLTFDQYEEAIIRALRKHPEGIRNTKLNQEAAVDRKIINVKTYNKHLKWLVNQGVVVRVEEGRAKVTYKLHPTKSEEEFRRILDVGIQGFVVGPLESLFEERKTFDSARAIQREFNKILRNATTPLRNGFVSAIRDINDPVDFSLHINQTTEFFRETAIRVGRIIERSDETRAFFYPLLKEVVCYL